MKRYEVRKTDYKWSPCWGLFDNKLNRWITKDVYKKLILKHIKDEGLDMNEEIERNKS